MDFEGIQVYDGNGCDVLEGEEYEYEQKAGGRGRIGRDGAGGGLEKESGERGDGWGMGAVWNVSVFPET